MKILMGTNMIHLEGDWTLAGMTFSNVDSVTDSLQQARLEGAKKLLIDCKNISRFDVVGIQFLQIWLKLFKCRGVQTEIVNLSGNLGIHPEHLP